MVLYLYRIYCNCTAFLPDSYGYMPLLLWAIAWYFLSGKSQAKLVKTIKYSKKPWVKLVLIATGIMVISLPVFILIGCGDVTASNIDLVQGGTMNINQSTMIG